MIFSFDGKERDEYLELGKTALNVHIANRRKGWRPKKGSRAANETKQPISPNLNSICPSLLLNDTNSAVLMECNYFNPIKCRLSFWSDAVALRKRHDHVRRHLMRNRSAEDAYAAVLGFKWKVHTNTEGKKNDTKKVSKKWKKKERQERETVEGNKRTYIHA